MQLAFGVVLRVTILVEETVLESHRYQNGVNWASLSSSASGKNTPKVSLGLINPNSTLSSASGSTDLAKMQNFFSTQQSSFWVGAKGDPSNTSTPAYGSGSLDLLQGAKMDYDLAATIDSDLISIPAGLLVLNSQQFSDFSFSPLANFGPGAYTLFDAGSISGALGNSLSGPIGNGFTGTLAIQVNNLVLNVVPEPGTLGLLGVTFLGFLSGVRKRRAKARDSSRRT